MISLIRSQPFQKARKRLRGYRDLCYRCATVKGTAEDAAASPALFSEKEALEAALSLVRERHYNGALYDRVLYLTYFSKEKRPSEDVITELNEEGFLMERSTYYRYLDLAVSALAMALYGSAPKPKDEEGEA